MTRTVYISRERYEYLIECERLVELEFEERFSAAFIKEVKESVRDYKEGRFKRFKPTFFIVSNTFFYFLNKGCREPFFKFEFYQSLTFYQILIPLSGNTHCSCHFISPCK